MMSRYAATVEPVFSMSTRPGTILKKYFMIDGKLNEVTVDYCNEDRRINGCYRRFKGYTLCFCPVTIQHERGYSTSTIRPIECRHYLLTELMPNQRRTAKTDDAALAEAEYQFSDMGLEEVFPFARSGSGQLTPEDREYADEPKQTPAPVEKPAEEPKPVEKPVVKPKPTPTPKPKKKKAPTEAPKPAKKGLSYVVKVNGEIWGTFSSKAKAESEKKKLKTTGEPVKIFVVWC